jgi:signal transduction histidine kinase/ligand-binding sensor domain-containing protein
MDCGYAPSVAAHYGRWRALCVVVLILLLRVSGGGQVLQRASVSLETKPLVAHVVWTGKDGAPGNVTALSQTSDGYLWIGTSLGLYRFDGVQFSSYPTEGLEEKLPASNITALRSDEKGGLWIGFLWGGISYLSSDGKVTNYNARNGRGPNSAAKFITRSDGSIWALGDNALLRFQGDRWDNYGVRHGLPSEELFTFYFDRQGDLWTAKRNTIFVLRRGRDTFEVYPTKAKSVTDFAETPDGELWISDGWHGVRPLVAGYDRSTVPIRGVATLLVEPSGTIWLAHDYRGVSHFQSFVPGEPPTTVVEETGLTSQQTTSIIRDRDGNIWIGTNRGLDRFQPTSLRSLSDLKLEYYPALTADPVNGIWIAPHERTLLHASGTSLTPIGPSVGSSPVVCDDLGRVWLVDPLAHALTRYDHGTVTRIPEPPEVHDTDAKSIVMDRDGVVLVSFEGYGMWRFTTHWEHVEQLGLPPDEPLSMYRDPANRVWLGYGDGVIALHDGHGYRTFAGQQATSLGNVLTFLLSHGKLWAAGVDGVAVFDNEKFHRLSLTKGGALRGVSGIVEDKMGNLWLNGSTGIIRIADQDVRKFLADGSPADFDLLDERQGVMGTATQMKPTPSAVADRTGLLWFATSGNVFSLSPSSFVMRRSVPAVAVEQVILNGSPVLDREHLNAHITTRADRLRTLEFDYIGIDLASPESVGYRYILEGEDRGWQDAGDRRQAFYSHLRPGSYRFRVLATNGRGQWSELDRTLNLTITPAFYQTVWFYFLCALAALGLLCLAYLARVRYITNRLRERLRERSNERMRIARELHDTLLQSIHGLMLHFHVATESIPSGEPSRINLQKALDRADSLVHEGRRRVQELRDELPEGPGLAARIEQVAKELDIEKAMVFRLVEEGTRREICIAVQVEVSKIIREALMNSILHSQALSAEVVLSYGGTTFSVSCKDTGVGLPPSVSADGKRAGHWGLVGMRERASAMNGRMQIRSAPGRGTEIDVRVPSKRAYFVSRINRSWLRRLLPNPHEASGQDSDWGDRF